MHKLTKKNTEYIPRLRRIFMNQMNSWLGNFLIEELRTEHLLDPKVVKNDFVGMRNNTNMDLPYLFKPFEVKIDYNPHFESDIFRCDVFVYTLEDSEYNEIEYIIKGLKTIKHNTEKVLIIISSIMTWARTKIKLDNEDKVKPFDFTDFTDRLPNKKYYLYKQIENLAFSASNVNSMLRVYVVCPGLIYGCGEGILYDYLKMSWLGEVKSLPIIGNGDNAIPTIHIKDLAKLIKRIIERLPEEKYIFAVDRTKDKSLKNIMTSVSKCLGNGEIDHLYEFNETVTNIPAYNELTINVPCESTNLFNDKRLKEEDDEDWKKKKFKWHCEGGIPENIDKIRQEFMQYRNLKSTRIFITGPPVAGKSTLAEKLSEYYNLPLFKISDIIDYTLHQLNPEDPMRLEVVDKIEEMKDKVIAEQEELQKKQKNKKKIEPTPERSSINIRLPDDLCIKMARNIIEDNKYKNKGYILDGYPRSFKDCALFCNNIHEEDMSRNKFIEDISPNIVIKIEEISEDLVKSRAKNLHSNPRYTDEHTSKRLSNYKILNETQPSVSKFFEERGMKILSINPKLEEEEIYNLSRNHIGKVSSFDDRTEDVMIKSNLVDTDSEMKNDFINRVESALEEQSKDEINDPEYKKQLEALKDREKLLLEKKSEIIRHFINENVMPMLSKGILEICENLPDDPVEYLSVFLYNNCSKLNFNSDK